jgi:hypothetical protein
VQVSEHAPEALCFVEVGSVCFWVCGLLILWCEMLIPDVGYAVCGTEKQCIA